jgi:hypothetical protein
MSGSCASNMGYGRIFPNSNVNARFVNIGNTDYSGGFSSNQIPGFPNYPGLPAAKSNIAAAAGVIPHRGGSKNIKRKIKNITKKYKMNKKTLRKRASILRKKIKRRITKHRRSRQRGGGYSQYQNNMPLTPSYSTGGYLNPNNSALANPVPYKTLSVGATCLDNYNHFTGKTFQSMGH